MPRTSPAVSNAMPDTRHVQITTGAHGVRDGSRPVAMARARRGSTVDRSCAISLKIRLSRAENDMRITSHAAKRQR